MNSSSLGADGVSTARHTGQLDKATRTCDAQHLSLRKQPYLQDRQEATSPSIYSSISPPFPVVPLMQCEAGGNYSRFPAGDSLGKCNGGLAHSRVAFPAVPGAEEHS